MPFFKSRKNKNRRTDGTGFLTYADAYQLIKDNIDEAVEFYELEPAIVTEVFLEPKKLPRKDIPNGDGKMPDYSYLGTIRARFIESQSDGDVIDDYIKPLSPHMVAYPLIGEVVNIAKHGSQMYYYQPLNLKNHVNMNLANNTLTDPRVTSRTTEFNRNILSEYGDVVFNGRFGQSMKFGSDPFYLYPDVKITNRQSVLPQTIADEHYPHVQNINADGSSIFMTSGPAREVDVLIPAVQTLTTPDVLDGDMITLNSDRIVFNSKQTDIHMFARRNLNLSANEEINLELGINSIGGRITLGDAESTNPMVLGNQLEDLFEKLLTSLVSFSNSVSSATGIAEVGDASKVMLNEVQNIKSNVLPKILSDTVYITENQIDEITSINEVEGEVERPTQVAGVRG
jgi:hypothetical protein|tara:strand:+ start:81 stop:1277 length:1197 start_codon:yes stop_codon:yes gene_type:complete